MFHSETKSEEESANQRSQSRLHLSVPLQATKRLCLPLLVRGVLGFRDLVGLSSVDSVDSPRYWSISILTSFTFLLNSLLKTLQTIPVSLASSLIPIVRGTFSLFVSSDEGIEDSARRNSLLHKKPPLLPPPFCAFPLAWQIHQALAHYKRQSAETRISSFAGSIAPQTHHLQASSFTKP